MVIVEGWLGMSLPTAGVVIGWLMFSLCCLEGAILLVILMDVPNMAEKIVRPDHQNRNVAVKYMKTFAYITLSVYLTYVLVDIVANLLLIYGSHSQSRFLLLPWLLSNCISIVFKLAASFFGIVVWIISSGNDSRIVVTLLNLGCTAIHLWMWIVVFSLYVEIRDNVI